MIRQQSLQLLQSFELRSNQSNISNLGTDQGGPGKIWFSRGKKDRQECLSYFTRGSLVASTIVGQKLELEFRTPSCKLGGEFAGGGGEDLGVGVDVGGGGGGRH